ncbi:peroxide stress protein YaaA [Microbacterium sp. NPDC019599]|uniref:YaaA family protein n=1 Tax=Microbacterium sp. NPDC019599 TaxID=3154690 RepID=UPI0033D3303F
MLILLPPSETKRSGGSRRPVDLEGLALPALREQRAQVLAALEELATDAETAARVLKLGPSQLGEIDDNARVTSSPTMAAVDRYTGVLYDALGAASLDSAARAWLARRVLIHSAPLGPVGALDRIPAYRLSAGTSLPGIPPLRRLWAAPVSHALEAADPGFVLDLRSEAYAALGPVPASVASAYVRVVAESEGGAVRALNHFNKHANGALVRRLAVQRPRLSSRAGFVRWADAAGIRVREGSAGELELFA